MGVDFYTCQNCERNFPDCSYFFTCTQCDHMFCSDKCGGKKVEKEDPKGDSYNDLTLGHFNLTREQAMELYRGE
jgi:hypothetical protein